ncbi:MAG: serine/threonine-protein kinase [Myxococcales bacterium]
MKELKCAPRRDGEASATGTRRVLDDDDPTEIISEVPKGKSPLDMAIGDRIGDYVLERHIGDGGGGIVYAARHQLTGRAVALKLLRPEMALLNKMVTRFVREAEAVNRIKHPNIVEMLEFGELQPGRPYYVMELLEGMDLGTYLRTKGRLRPPACFEILAPALSAVAAAHKVGIVHRDIKASNIFVAQINGKQTVKLLDFGIAKQVNPEPGKEGLTEPGARLGTASNMAPEQIRCERTDERTDIYAIGVVMFQLMTGHYPFEADDPWQMSWLHLQAPPPQPSLLVARIPPALDAVILKCLEKKPEARFQSVDDLIAAFRAAIA